MRTLHECLLHQVYTNNWAPEDSSAAPYNQVLSHYYITTHGILVAARMRQVLSCHVLNRHADASV
jgi:hypothetical protein